MKKKILHLITGLEIGGAETMLLEVMPRLDQFQHIICSLSTIGPSGKKLIDAGFTVYALKSGKIFSPAAIYRFGRIIFREKPDLIATRLIHADIFGRIFGKIFGVHKILCCLESVLDQPKYQKFFLLEQVTSFLVNQYVAVSQAVKDAYLSKTKIIPSKITVIYNGIDLHKFKPTVNKTAAKKNTGLDDYQPIIGYVAKMRPERNHRLLIEAFANIQKTYPTALLVLAGDGPARPDLEKLAANLNIKNQIKFLGNRHDIPNILSCLDIFVSPSAYEGMSVSILEAMACGVPVIASDIAPNREIIENKKNGILIPSLQAPIIAEEISSLLSNGALLQSISLNSITIAQKFSIDTTAHCLTELYLSL